MKPTDRPDAPTTADDLADYTAELRVLTAAELRAELHHQPADLHAVILAELARRPARSKRRATPPTAAAEFRAIAATAAGLRKRGGRAANLAGGEPVGLSLMDYRLRQAELEALQIATALEPPPCKS